jgi:hypothetical protein
MLSVADKHIMLNVIMLSVILSVVAPFIVIFYAYCCDTK